MRTDRPVILIGICSCLRHAVRRDGCRDTWLQDIDEGISYKFFVGKGKGAAPVVDMDVVQLDIEDHYAALPKKVMAWYKYTVDYYSYDWLFKCDDDTYIATDRIRALCNPAADMIGNLWVYWRGSPSGGAGYMMSRRLVEQFVENEDKMQSWNQEDLVFGRLAKDLNAGMLGDGRLNYASNFSPQPGNNQITAHWCTPDKMKQIYAEYHGEKWDDKAGEPGSKAAGKGRENDEASDGKAKATG